MPKAYCCCRLRTVWCLIVLFALLTVAQLCLYVARSAHPYTSVPSVGGSLPRRRSELSLCPLVDSRHRSLPLSRRTDVYQCKQPGRQIFSHLDSKKFVFARYIGEVNGTSAEESNHLNLIANAIDMNGYVVQDSSLLTSQCLLPNENDESDECTCSCLGESSDNCTITAAAAVGTKLFGTKCYHKSSLTQFPDKEQFNKVLCDNGLPRTMSVDSFLQNSYRSIVFVHPVNKLHPLHKLSSEQNLIQEKLRLDSPIIDCNEFQSVYNMTASILANLNSLSKAFCLNEFKMVGCYCIAAWYKSNDLGMYWFADEKVSVIFTSWMGLDRDDSDILIPVVEPNEPKTDGEPSSDLTTTKKPEEQVPHGVVRRRHHSSLAKMVLQQTKKFIKAMAQGKQYIVVHLRIDNSLSGYAQRPDFPLYYKSCLFKVKAELNKLMVEHPDSLVFFFMDLTTDVSGNKNSSSAVQFRMVKTLLLGEKYEIQHYSADKYGGRSDTPFVTLVEQEFMCRASYLLTLGGGQIQDRLKKRFLKMHFRKKLLDFESCDANMSANASPRFPK